tara:strand:+ start:1097 stop:1846 length:750 start_codon:yes stop_codon:yes gene_type:complete
VNKFKENLSIVIMAAGKGTRMYSDIPKVLHKLSGETLLNHVIEKANNLSPSNIVIIIGHEAEQVKEAVPSNEILFSYQKQQMGTGHAVMQAQNHLHDFVGNTLVLSGDVPLIQSSTLLEFIQNHENGSFDASMITANFDDPDGYGRVIRNSSGNLEKVKEHKDCNDIEKKIKEINSGIYIFNNQILFNLLPKLDNDNEQLEYYLPDVLSMILANGGKIGLEKIKNINEIQGINTLDQLSYLENIYEKNN